MPKNGTSKKECIKLKGHFGVIFAASLERCVVTPKSSLQVKPFSMSIVFRLQDHLWHFLRLESIHVGKRQQRSNSVQHPRRLARPVVRNICATHICRGLLRLQEKGRSIVGPCYFSCEFMSS